MHFSHQKGWPITFATKQHARSAFYPPKEKAEGAEGAEGAMAA